MTNLSNGYPWGIWIAFDVVVGTALGCGGYAVALLVFILNKGEYHPLVRPAVLTSLLGYGLAVLAVTVDLGRYWDLWKIPIFFWQWSHSPQLEVAICVMLYNFVLLAELCRPCGRSSRRVPSRASRRSRPGPLRFIHKGGVWIIALGILLPTMHQSSLGTMMLLAGPRLHALWFTPWLPFLFILSCLILGYGIVVCEASFAAKTFGRPRETEMLGRLANVAKWVALFFVAFRIGDVALSGELGLLASPLGAVFVAELAMHLAAAAVLMSATRRADPVWQVRAGILLILAGTGIPAQHLSRRLQPG